MQQSVREKRCENRHRKLQLQLESTAISEIKALWGWLGEVSEGGGENLAGQLPS